MSSGANRAEGLTEQLAKDSGLLILMSLGDLIKTFKDSMCVLHINKVCAGRTVGSDENR